MDSGQVGTIPTGHTTIFTTDVVDGGAQVSAAVDAAAETAYKVCFDLFSKRTIQEAGSSKVIARLKVRSSDAALSTQCLPPARAPVVFSPSITCTGAKLLAIHGRVFPGSPLPSQPAPWQSTSSAACHAPRSF
eukprot:1194372-Prorocentrum_minimum.AAC.4